MSENSRKTPILFCAFNRPELTKKVFQRIRSHQPAALYVHLDGPRKDHLEDYQRCAEVEQILRSVDWPCKVLYKILDQNLGCGPAMSGAISWFFEHVTEGIIVEDDCLPTTFFFDSCSTMLDSYRDNPSIMHISGMGLDVANQSKLPYWYRSSFPFIWGWATWKDAWQHYRYQLPTDQERSKILKKQFTDPNTISYWEDKFSAVAVGDINTWDYQWLLTVWRLGGYSLTPSESLVANIGGDHSATHPGGDTSHRFSALTGNQALPPSQWQEKNLATDEVNRVINNRIFETHRFTPKTWFLKIPFLKWLYYGVRNRWSTFTSVIRSCCHSRV